MFFLLFLIWLVLNGRVDLEVVLTGAAVSAALTWLARVVLHLPPWGGLRLIRRLPRVFLYLFYLFGQVVVSNLQVMERILFPHKRKGGGRLVWFRTDLKEEGTRLTLANSITLTPGTVTVSLKGDRLCVHALDEEFADGIKDNGFAPRLERWEEGDHG
ncbi:Na+/H+ antiporter subunit E [Pseudoflavonifractor phocaeensis]|nr:Na+/H+ antiporter subunit E [Pseudoflavonifractor phocaeensis]MDM8237907.1 Na+/H+ antiporter subunit E [Pseudoflavonifractor phocaeensis]